MTDSPTDRFADLVRDVLSRGDRCWRPLGRPGHWLGYVVLSVPRVCRAFMRYHDQEELWPPHPTEADVRQWVPAAANWLRSRAESDLILGMSLARREADHRRREVVPAVGTSEAEDYWRHRAEDADSGTSARVASERARLFFTLLRMFSLPVSRFLPRRVQQAIPEARDVNGREASLGEFAALAIESGNPIALQGLTEWMGLKRTDRRKTTRDWRTILEQFSVSKQFLRTWLPKARRQAADGEGWASLVTQDTMARRLDVANLRDETIGASPLSPADLAAELTACEHGVKATTIRQYWKDRARFLPSTISELGSDQTGG